MKLVRAYLVLIGFLTLHVTVQASTTSENKMDFQTVDNLWDKETLNAIFTSWAESKKLAASDISAVQKSLAEKQDLTQGLTCLVKQLVQLGIEDEEIEKLLINNEFSIPDEAKLDRGYHQLVMGRSSKLGSVIDNFKGFRKVGLGNWIFLNGVKLLTYYKTLEMITGFIIPAAATVIEPAYECPLPKGSYAQSCQPIAVPYKSSDPLVPSDSCILNTKCSYIIPSIPPTPQTYYYQPGDGSILDNQNGTLVLVGRNNEIVPVDELRKQITCTQPLPGSFERTCKVSVRPYESTDPNLVNTAFCQMSAECKKIGGAGYGNQQNVVYYGQQHLHGATGAAENCDGVLVVHADRRNDGKCELKSTEDIRNLASNQGSTVHVLGQNQPPKDEL